MPEFDFPGLAAALLPLARLLVTDWLPGGMMSGHEYVCAGIRGGQGRSFSVNVVTGKWADFADAGVAGGDLISLYAAIEGLKQGEAAKRLAERINFQLAGERAAEPKAKICAPPIGAAQPAMRHGHYGEPTATWRYAGADGLTLFYIARYDPPEGRKQYVPWTWDALEQAWGMKAWPAPRPIYGLDRLLDAGADKPVLVVEGEKAAEAARSWGETYVVVSWPGGAAAWRKVDWSPLNGRRVLLWPDADRKIADTEERAQKAGVKLGELLPYELQPGPAAMAGIAALLHGKAAEVKVIDVGVELERADGWDAADALEQGFTWEQVVEWAKPRAAVFGPPAPAVDGQVISAAAPASDVADLEDPAPRTLYAEWEKIGIATTQSGAPICNIDNALRVMEKREEFKDLVWYDEFHKRYLTRFNFETWERDVVREWSDVDELKLTAFMQRQLGLRRISDDMVHKAAIVHAQANVKNEPRDWLNGLAWDGQDRISGFFTECLGALGSDYAQAASKNFWVGMVARVFLPGCQLDNMVVFEGPQGAGKSRAMRAIGGEWHTEVKENVTSNDFFMVLHGRLLVEIAELDSFNRAEITRIKQVVTCPTDRYRAPYARAAQDHKRMSIFAATTNESIYLKDHTGARRFWPIKCGHIKLERIVEQREQLFAEAVARFKRKEGWHEMPAAETAEEQEQRRQADEWESIVTEYLVDKKETTIRDVADYLKIETPKLDMILQKRIANIMRTVGWEKATKRDGGGRTVRIWREVELPFRDPPAGQGRLGVD